MEAVNVVAPYPSDEPRSHRAHLSGYDPAEEDVLCEKNERSGGATLRSRWHRARPAVSPAAHMG